MKYCHVLNPYSTNFVELAYFPVTMTFPIIYYFTNGSSSKQKYTLVCCHCHLISRKFSSLLVITHLTVLAAFYHFSPLLCAALRSGDFMMIDLDKNEVSALTIGRAMASRIEPVAFLQVGNPVESDETELVLAYNQAVVFKSTEGGDSRQYDIKWTSRPQHIAYVYPYLLGFTRETIEVVTMINGSLVKTLPMPNLQLIANHGGVFFTSTTARGTSLFKMSADTLSGKTSVDEEFGMSGSSQISGTANVFVRRLSRYVVASML